MVKIYLDILSIESNVMIFPLIRSVTRQVGIRIRSRLGFSNDFYAAAVDKQEICPSEIIEGPPTKVLPGQFDRVTGAAFGRSILDEISVLQGRARRVQPTEMYCFKNVEIIRSWVITKKNYEIFGWPKNEWALKAPKEIGVANLTSSYQGNRYFGHWLRDDCASSLLFSKSDRNIAVPRPSWADAEFYQSAFNLPRPEMVQNVAISEMFYCNDIIQNSNKAKRFQILRDRIRKSILPVRANDIVYIARGVSAKARKFNNELEVANALVNRGVNVVFAEELNTSEFVRTILDARIIISVEGSQLSHALYALRKKNAGIVVIQPPDRLFTSHLDWARVMAVNFGTIVGIQEENGFFVPPDDIFRTIDLF